VINEAVAEELSLSRPSVVLGQDRINLFLTKFQDAAKSFRHRNASYVANQTEWRRWTYAQPGHLIARRACDICYSDTETVPQMLREEFYEFNGPFIVEFPIHLFNHGMTYSMIVPGPGKDNLWFIRADVINAHFQIHRVFLSLNLNQLKEMSDSMTKAFRSKAFLQASPLDRQAMKIAEGLKLFKVDTFHPSEKSSMFDLQSESHTSLGAAFTAIGSLYMMNKTSTSVCSPTSYMKN
jgi:hypothetical protein